MNREQYFKQKSERKKATINAMFEAHKNRKPMKRQFNRYEPLGKNGERIIYGVAIVAIIALVAKCMGVMPE